MSYDNGRDEYETGERETGYSIFVEENKGDLVKGFVEENQELYEEFLKQFGEDTHGKHIQEGFAEYHFTLFRRYCEAIYENTNDILETEQQISRSYARGTF